MLDSFSKDFYSLVAQYHNSEDLALQESIRKSRKVLEDRHWQSKASDVIRTVRDYFSGSGTKEFLELKAKVRQLASATEKQAKISEISGAFLLEPQSAAKEMPESPPSLEQDCAISAARRQMTDDELKMVSNAFDALSACGIPPTIEGNIDGFYMTAEKQLDEFLEEQKAIQLSNRNDPEAVDHMIRAVRQYVIEVLKREKTIIKQYCYSFQKLRQIVC